MKSKYFKGLNCFFLTLFFSCSIFSIEGKPYSLAANFVMEENSADYKICGADLYFYNQTNRTVKEIEVVFYLFDEEGEPAAECSGRIIFELEKEVGPEEDFRLCLNLDPFMTYIPQSPLEIDYLYVSKILYADGTLWQDPFGFTAFM